MRYDNGFGRGYDRGWQGGGRDEHMPRYDSIFRGRGAAPGAGVPGAGQHRRGREAGAAGWRDEPWRNAPGPAAHASDNQVLRGGETDFMGHPYPPEARRNIPWGLIEQERMQARGAGYDAGYRGRPAGEDRGFRGYDRGYPRGGMMQGGNGGGGYGPPPARGGYGQPSPGAGYGGMQGGNGPSGRGGGYGARPGYDADFDVAPDRYHPRFIADGDEAGYDLHRSGRIHPGQHYTSQWTRWF